MEGRNYMKMGREFLRNAGKLTLKVAPLALAAAHLAHATSVIGPTYTFSGGSAVASCSGGGCGSVSPGAFVCNNTGLGGTISFAISGDTTFTQDTNPTSALVLTWNGFFSSPLLSGVSVPYSYAFSVIDSNNLPVNYALQFTGALSDSVSGTTAPAQVSQPVSGTGAAISTGSTNFSVALTLNFVGAAASGDTLTASVPPGATIDVPLTSNLVPEPATFALIVPALGALWLVRRRRKP